MPKWNLIKYNKTWMREKKNAKECNAERMPAIYTTYYGANGANEHSQA